MAVRVKVVAAWNEDLRAPDRAKALAGSSPAFGGGHPPEGVGIQKIGR